MLLESTRRKLEEAFKCKISNQYGCYEANSIAYECLCEKLHCIKDNIYVEIVNNVEKEKNYEENDTSSYYYVFYFMLMWDKKRSSS